MQDIDGLIKTASLSKKGINLHRLSYYYRTAKSSHKDELEKDGWEIVPTKLKKSIRMRKPKPHHQAFEDRVWALLADMKFQYLNESNRFQLRYTPELSKKVDIFAAEEEAVLIVECKSTDAERRVSYQKDINELIGIKDKLRQSAQKLFPGKPKVAFLFATNNATLSENDLNRLKEGGIFHLNNAEIEYWEQLADHLGEAAKYQLFGKLFAGRDIPNLPHRVPAIKGKMASGYVFYSFSIDPKFLLRIAFVLHRSEADAEAAEAYQRLVKRDRLKNIGKFIDRGGYFPNSIIINIETKKQDLQFDLAASGEHDSTTKLGILHLPREYRSVFIIDGQHRLYGYSKAQSKSHHTVPIVAFVNLPQAEQAKIFVDINREQRSVQPNLLHSIRADFDWESDDAGCAISSVKTRMISRLNYDETSPFYRRIVLSDEKTTTTRCLTLEAIKRWGLGSSTGFFGRIKGKKLIKTGYLSDVSYDQTLTKSVEFFRCCFNFVRNELPDQWAIGADEGGFIAMNLGVSSMIRTIDYVLDYLVRFENVHPEEQSGQSLADNVIPYLIPVVDYIKSLDFKKLKELRSHFGSGSPEIVTMQFLESIHSKFNDFSPDGLQQWIRDNSGMFNNSAYDLGHNLIEPMMHEFIIRQLKKEFGEMSWWAEGVSEKIQKACSMARIEEHSTEQDWNFLNTIHYKDIIEDNWQQLGDYFTPPRMENVKREKKLAWLVTLNQIRKHYSHPQRPNIKEEEYNFLQETLEWLRIKLTVKI